MPLLGVITGSTRPTRVGPAFANWFAEVAKKHGAFDVKSIDLLELDLPPFNEPDYPVLQKYVHAHTKAWSKTVLELDAVVFVTPEYNYAPPPALINALTYLVQEWAYMPAGFVGYSAGGAGAARSILNLKVPVTALKMMAITEPPLLFSHCLNLLDENGVFTKASQTDETFAGLVLDELARWTAALAGLRAEQVKKHSIPASD